MIEEHSRNTGRLTEVCRVQIRWVENGCLFSHGAAARIT